MAMPRNLQCPVMGSKSWLKLSDSVRLGPKPRFKECSRPPDSRDSSLCFRKSRIIVGGKKSAGSIPSSVNGSGNEESQIL